MEANVMNLFKPKFRDRKTGQLVETPRWYYDFRDHFGIRQRFRGSEDEHETAELGKMIEDLVRCRKRKVQPKDKLWTWLMGIEPDVQKRLVKLDLAERQWFAQLTQGERLSAWVDEYENWLRKSKGKRGYHRNQTYVEVTMTRIRNIVNGCGFTTWPDIRKGSIETYLGGLSITTGTFNGYVTSIKTFCMWCVREGKADFSPVQFLDRLAKSDKEKRQALGFDKVCRLLTAAVNGPVIRHMTGMERAVLYRIAIETGYRVNELRNLTVADFDKKKSTISQQAKYCKDRRDATQPITMALASSLTDYLEGRDTTGPIFAYVPDRTAEMIQADAIKARLSLIDDQGRELVFHSLRHTLREELRKGRVAESVIDNIMRHKPAGVGQRFYTHITDFEIREAIERLPEYPWPGDIVEQAKKAVS